MEDKNTADTSELRALWDQLVKRYHVEQPRMLEKALENGSKRLPSYLPLSKVVSDCVNTLKILVKQGEDPNLKYSSLPLNAISLPPAFSIHELAGVLKDREYRTKNIIKHGVAPYISSNANRVAFFAEDSKGRTHELLSMMGKSEFTPVNFMIKGDTNPLNFDNGNVAVANALKIEPTSIYSPYGDKLKGKILNAMNKGTVVTHGTFLFEHAKRHSSQGLKISLLLNLMGTLLIKAKSHYPLATTPQLLPRSIK